MRRDQERFEPEEGFQKDFPDDHSGVSPENRDNRDNDHDIIELVDVVRKGDLPPDTDTDDLSLLFDPENQPGKGEDFLGREDEALDGFSLPLDETDEEAFESHASEPVAFHDPFESPDFDFEAAESFDESTEEEVTAISEEDLEEIPEEGLDLPMGGLVGEMEDETSGPEPRDEGSFPVSKERLESLIIETVTEVVERVVRETVAEVAERVIKEAIESLRQSLESKPE